MLTITIETDDSGIIFATSEDGDGGLFVAALSFDALWPALERAVADWRLINVSN